VTWSWTQPACESCFRREYPRTIPNPLVDEYREVEICVWCGEQTRSGLYVRVDPSRVSFPTRTK
jgi:hypothetical protein